MAVPRKRKKLAEKPEHQKKRNRPGSQKQPSNKRKAENSSSKKIDDAFKIMTTIEDKPKRRITTAKEKTLTPVEEKEISPPKPSSKRMGFRFQISLDALMPNKERRLSETRKKPIKESTVVDIDLTIPFIWDLPIIGGMTQKFFKNFKTIKF
jgi:hypothetical protein